MQSQTLKFISCAEAADKFQLDKHELEFAINDSVDGTIIQQRKVYNHGGDLQGSIQLIKNTSVWDETGLVRLAFWKGPAICQF